MIQKRVDVEIVIRCDVGLCDHGNGRITQALSGKTEAAILKTLEEAGWAISAFDSCPACFNRLRKRNGETFPEATE